MSGSGVHRMSPQGWTLLGHLDEAIEEWHGVLPQEVVDGDDSHERHGEDPDHERRKSIPATREVFWIPARCLTRVQCGWLNEYTKGLLQWPASFPIVMPRGCVRSVILIPNEPLAPKACG